MDEHASEVGELNERIGDLETELHEATETLDARAEALKTFAEAIATWDDGERDHGSDVALLVAWDEYRCAVSHD